MNSDQRYSDLAITQKAFHEDPYARRSQATVLDVDGEDVVVDATIFYAESGGQTADTGSIADIEVVDVQKEAGRRVRLPNDETARVESVIRHRLVRAPEFSVGDRVDLEIDWARRYHNMQMHTLAHFLFIATGEHLAMRGEQQATKGCFIEEDSARFDFVGKIDGEAVPGIADRVRELVATAGQATTEKLQDDVFIWRCAGYEIPCGGTHVRDASEIVGEVELRRRSKGSSLTRLYVTLARPE